MSKPIWYFLILSLLLNLFFAALFLAREQETKMRRLYNKISPGMPFLEVERMLGPGTLVKQSEVPHFPDFRESDPAKRSKPVVTGNTCYRWTDAQGREIVIGFVDEKVYQKSYWEASL